METLYTAAHHKARGIFDAGRFDEHFALTVLRELMPDANARKLCEQVIESEAYTYGAPKKTKIPLNMHFGWYTRNAINAQPLLENTGKPRHGFTKGEPIKSTILLQTTSAGTSALAKSSLGARR